jgi:ABC-2 type transport system ATP-binding protein
VTAVVVAESLTRRFGELLAVDRLTLSIEAGEVLGFLGPNGAGKTTTVRMLAALIAPSSGTGAVCGHALGRDDMAVRRSIGLLTETPGMYDRLSAARNLEIFASLYRVPDVAGQVEKYLKMLGLWDRRRDPAGSFSKGMKQKLAIARALLHEPPVLYLDEPTSGLDPEAAQLVRDAISDLRQNGRTILLCTHNLEEADRLCDRIALFKTRLLALDTAANLREALFGRQVVVHLAEATAAHEEVVRRLPFVREVSRAEVRLVLRVDDPEASNPAIIRALVAAGADIRFVGELRHSLEDVYMQLLKASP